MGGDTIFALSSGGLPSGIAVVRISGARARFVVETICGQLDTPRSLQLRTFRNRLGCVLDRGLVTFFPPPNSFTGEFCAEFHLHGSRAVVAAILREIASFDGTRQAEPGEFTKRAFINGKVDLTEAEALADLLSAETEAQRRLAVANTHGAQKQLYESWRKRMLHARALIEAELDFTDESDVPASVSDHAFADLAALETSIREHVRGYAQAEIIRDGFRVVLLGAPNCGKSSLLNALVRREAAIVSDEPGTTRDPIEVSLDLGGMKVVITDTAGIRVGAGKVESIGIERALDRVRDAHLVLRLQDRSNPLAVDLPDDVPSILVATKIDLPGADLEKCDIALSSVTGVGLGKLTDCLQKFAGAAVLRGDTLPSRLRHVQLLEQCAQQIGASLSATGGLELQAEHLRQAANSLGRITGISNVEELLGVIFSEFCVGK